MYGRLFLLFAISMACVAQSCSNYSATYDTYVIDITPVDSGVEREITIFNCRDDPDSFRTKGLFVEDEEADCLERLYGVRPPLRYSDSTLTSDTVVVYVARRRFHSIPEDLANCGSIKCYVSALGQTGTYVERVGGYSDPLAGVEPALNAADSLVDMILGWTESELGHHPGWRMLRAEIDTRLRRVVRGIAYLAWRPDSAAEARFVSIETEYPLIRLVLNTYDEWTLWRVRGAMAETLGLHTKSEIEEILGFISAPESTRERFFRYLSAAMGESEQVAQERWDAILETVVNYEGESYDDYDYDSVFVRLRVPSINTDLTTNGSWDEALGYVEWSGRIRHPDRAAGDPVVCVAYWSVPDSLVQRRLFGDVRLKGQALVNYCQWYHMLDPEQRTEWDAMLMRLRPGKTRRLERFSFSGNATEALVTRGRDLILNAIRPVPSPPRGSSVVPPSPE